MEDNTKTDSTEQKAQVEIGPMPTLHEDMVLTWQEADMLAAFRLMGLTPETVVVLIRGTIDILSIRTGGTEQIRLLTQKENLSSLLNLLTVK
jgi:hypothetical protein